jgi:hypothetical protein
MGTVTREYKQSLVGSLGMVLSGVSDIVQAAVSSASIVAPSSTDNERRASASQQQAYNSISLSSVAPTIASGNKEYATSTSTGGHEEYPVLSKVASNLVTQSRECSNKTRLGRFTGLMRSLAVRSAANKYSFLVSLFGHRNAQRISHVVQHGCITECPVPLLMLQACVHCIEAMSLLLAAGLRLDPSGVSLEHLPALVSSLMGLENAMKAYKLSYSKYQMNVTSSTPTSVVYSSDATEIKATGAQSRIKISAGISACEVLSEPSLVAQPQWATADLYVVESAIEDAFTLLFRHFGDVIPTYSYPSDAISSLRQRIAECYAADEL